MPERYVVKLSREEMERRRLAAGRDLLASIGERGIQARIAEKYRVSDATANRWHQVVRKKGLAGLRRTRASGAARLTVPQKAKLRGMLLEGALVHGFDTDVWTGRRVARLVSDAFRVRYNWKYVPQLLREQFDFSVQKPDRRPRELDDAKVQTWLREKWEPAKKGPPKESGASGSSTSPARRPRRS